MSLLQISCPPLPHYIAGYDDTFAVGQTHASRRAIRVFDLIVVTKGCLHIGEESEDWHVKAGHALILRPDRNHFGTKPCSEETHYYWLHFYTDRPWTEVPEETAPEDTANAADHFTPARFSIALPRYFQLTSPALIYGKLQQLKSLEGRSPAKSRLKQQLLFHELLLELSKEHPAVPDPLSVQLAERAAAYIGEHYTNAVSYRQLGELFNFHPAYVARCFKRVFRCTPLEYLIRCRIQKAKTSLLNSDKPIGQIAEDVGFANVSYFIRCFTKHAGVTPLQYRKLFRT